MPKIIKDRVKCPKCGSDTYAWGHPAGEHHLQRYRCKNPNCKRQFVPGKPERIKKYPTMPCPKCGGKMSIFKFLSDGYRLRCNNHIHKDNRHCHHKVNVPLPGKSFKIAKDPIECVNINVAVKFSWSKMNFSKSTVSLALYFAQFRALPATEVSQIFSDIFKLHISHDTITRWRHKAALNIHKNLGPLTVPKSKHKKLYADETVFKFNGHKQWLWLTKDSKYDSVQSWFLSPRRSTEFARSTFNIAFENSPSLKNSKIITDGLWSYPSALYDLKFNVEKNHHRYIGFFEDPLNNNNRLERHWSTFKVRARRFRGFKSKQGLWCFVTSEVYLHNYFLPNNRLKGLTPAQKVNVKLPHCLSKWKLFTLFL